MLVRPTLAVGMLAGAAAWDLRTRRVPNRYWFPFVLFALAFVGSDAVVAARSQWLGFAVAYGVAAFASAVLYLMWRFRMFGGADAKGLMVLAFLAAYPFPGGLGVPPVLDTLLLASCINILAVVGNLLWNLAHGELRLPAALLGIPMGLERARRSKVWPMQDVVDGKLVWRYWATGVDGQEALDRIAATGATRVWTTAKIPMMVSLALAFAITWAWGDPLMALAVRLAA